MGLRGSAVSEAELMKRTEEERENEHNSWLENRIYSKTTLGTFNQCRWKFYLRYIKRLDEAWGDDLIRGIAGHKVLEVFHARRLKGEDLFTAEARSLFMDEIERLEHRAVGRVSQRDLYASQVLALYELYKDHWRSWYDDVEGIEETWGIEEEVRMGGKRVAGHLDIRAESYVANGNKVKGRMVPDFKFCRPTSPNRRAKKIDMGGEMYRTGVNAKKTAIVPLVIGLKRKPRTMQDGQVCGEPSADGIPVIDGALPITHTKGTKESIEIQIADMVEAIERGDFHGGPPEVGKFLCSPQYCDFFGRDACRYTRHLSRKAFERKE